MDARVSWHPAFMPNSLSDLSTKNHHATLNSHTELNKPKLPSIETIPEFRDAAQSSQYVPITTSKSAEETEQQAELDNLRSALTTSLSSPGGVEMDDNPAHGGITAAGNFDAELGDSSPMADIPSERPVRELGHASSASFARTVPRDVDWGEDDDVDPEWNLQRTETDPFKEMAPSDRTNSFPQVPPNHTAEDTFDHAVPKHQAGELLSRAEHTSSLFGDDNNGCDFFGRVAESENMAKNSPQDPQERVPEDEYGTIYGGSITNEMRSDLRYDEGLPLVEEGEPAEGRQDDQPSDSALFGDNGANEEEDFFGELANSSKISSRPGFGRKSTIQVMGRLDFQPRDPSPTDTPDSNDAGSSQSSLDKATGGGIAVSRSTVLSQVLVESKISLSGEDEMHTASFRSPGTEDLAAQWKAALDGDEFLDEDELDEDAVASQVIDPAALFGSDDEGFLDDDEPGSNDDAYQQTSPPLPGPVIGDEGKPVGFNNLTSGTRPQPATSNSRYLPPSATQTHVQQPTNTYAPHAPLFTDFSAQPTQSPLPYGAGFGMAPPSNTPTLLPVQQRPDAQKSQSFANKSKGGYASPYDLPMEVVKPRKRASMQQMTRGHNAVPPPNNVLPPRSTSMVAQGPPPSRGSASSVSPPVSFSTLHQPPTKSQHIPGSAQQTGPPGLKSKASFFEDLPVTSKPKPAGRHSPQSSPSVYDVNAAPSIISTYQPSQQTPSQSFGAAQGLVAPPKASPYAPLPTGQPQPPIPTSRYSPAPPRSSSGNTPPPVVPQNRYASAPAQPQQLPSSHASQAQLPAPPAPPPQMLAHQPRTSSPLIHFERAPDRPPFTGSSTHGGLIRRESSGVDMGPRPTNLIHSREFEKQVHDDHPYDSNTVASSNSPYPAAAMPHHPHPVQQQMAQASFSPTKRATSNYVPDHRPGNVAFDPSFVPPQRSQTQSPSKVMAGSRIDGGVLDSQQRPSSVHSPNPPRSDAYSAMNTGGPKTRARGLSQGLNYIVPTDGREHDPLQRWRGGPVFYWGVGGTVVTSFPKEVPRYGIGQTMPMIICSPGEVKVRNLKDIYPLEERLSSFPGPLKGKSKKKEVITWLTVGIDTLERESSYLRSLATLSHDDKRKEERVLLWKILRVMIENDGLLEGSPAVNKSVRNVLSPGLDGESVAAPQYATGADLSGIFRAAGSSTISEPVDPSAVDELRKHLLRGEREKAVWEAVDKRLWAHAMLVSNTVSRELYRQVAQEFIQKEVKSIGENTESLAALYEIFAGNLEESVDELVPPSARAGLQMVSASGPSATSKSSLDGLDRWRETLGLVLSNRSPEDSQAISALGKLLSGYGRAEAAHICFLFARGYSVFGGVDDPLSNMVLVGSDHLRQPYEFDKELEPILLSEVFEYGLSLSTTSNIPFSAPHLAVYKLQHATILAQSGQRDKALQYCEAIASSVTSQVRRSPYHHSFLVAALDDLSKRLKQSPKDESSSWISKPSIDKVSGSVWAKFNKFVAGDENDAASGAGSEAGSEIGPFARIAGGTPSISRSPSNGDIYGTLARPPVNGNLAHLQSMKSHSRYAPVGAHTPAGVHDVSNPSSYDSQPHGSFTHRLSLEDTLRERGSFSNPGASNEQLARSYPDPTPAVPYESYLQSGPPYGAPYSPQHPITPPHEQQLSLSPHESPRSMAVSEGNPPATGYMPTGPGDNQLASGSSYVPPSSGGYEPPSYEPFEMNEEPNSPMDTRPKKKKSFMDDDDDDQPMRNASENINAGGSAAEKSKAEKDREADEAFRKAAEADAKKEAQAAPVKKGWGLGGWFAKREPTPDAVQPNKPIRAKLGEESSFVYDPELKRWINKKAGNDGTSEGPSSTPPPPRAGPPRTVSGSSMTETTSAPRPIAGVAPPQRSFSAFTPGSANSQSDGPSPSALAVPPPMMRTASHGSAAGGPASGPPSRPTTSMSNASSIDDLLGPPQARKGGAKKAKKGRGYIDVMEKKG